MADYFRSVCSLCRNNIGQALLIKVLFNDKRFRKDFNTCLKIGGLEKPGVILLCLATKVKCNLNACNDYTTFEQRGTEKD